MFWVIYYLFKRRFHCISNPGNGNGNCLLQHVICKILLKSVMRICHFVTWLTFYNSEIQSEVTPSLPRVKCPHILLCSHQENPSAKISASPSRFLSKVHNQKLAQTFVYHPFHIQKLSETHLIKLKNNSANAIRKADERSMSGLLNLYAGDELLSHHSIVSLVRTWSSSLESEEIIFILSLEGLIFLFLFNRKETAGKLGKASTVYLATYSPLASLVNRISFFQPGPLPCQIFSLNWIVIRKE